jgi:hypothetical protein
MSIKRALAIALVAAAALPASAGAQTPITPPAGDNYLGPFAFSTQQDFAHPGRFPSQEVGYIADTTNYTVQADMYAPPSSGGPPEPHQCGTLRDGRPDLYGKTVWTVFYADRYGRMSISTAGSIDGVIGVIPFKSPTGDPTPRLDLGYCQDSLGGLQEDTTFLVSPKSWYAIQVGGAEGGTTPSGGQVQAKFLLRKPASVDGQAFLFWASKGPTITNMYVKSVPKGEKVTVSCTKHACPKKTINVKTKPMAGLFSGKIAAPAPGVRMKAATGAGSEGAQPVALRPIVREAKKQVQIFKNQKVKKGATIELRITRPGYIGKYYAWSVAASSISAAKTLCMNPGSTKPRKRCSG